MKYGLICVDTLHYEKSFFAIKKTLFCKPDISTIYWFSDKKLDDKFILENCKVINIKIPRFRSKDYLLNYNNLYLNIIPYVLGDEDFYFTVHADGFAVNPDSWDENFLRYDYIGAPWESLNHMSVGNGGFSLRSKFFFESIKGLDLRKKNTLLEFDGEDAILCRYFYEEMKAMGIKYAPKELAYKFSIESEFSTREWLGKSFGFHGRFACHYYGYYYQDIS